MTEATPFLPGLSPLRRKPLTAAQDAGNLTSNGGLIVLRESALRSGVAAVVADAVPDKRNQLLVTHSYRAMVTARMMAIAAGYEDADDLDALRFDPALMLACNREPEGGHGIPSQPTISRLENVSDARTLYRIGIGYIDFFCRSYATPPHSIVLDIDDTDDLVHGGQQLALFNTHCRRSLLPADPHLRGQLRQADPVAAETRQAALGRGDRARALARDPPHPPALAQGAHSGAWRRPLLRAGSARFAARLRCDYILGLPINMKLDALAKPWREQCRGSREAGPIRRCAASISSPIRPDRGARQEKVIARVEATEMGSDARFIVTNLTGRGKDALREGLLRARPHGEPDQGHEALHALRQDRVLALAGQPVPAVPAHGRLLAPAFGADGGAEEVALARRDVRDHPRVVREDRLPRRGAEEQDQAGVPAPPAACRRLALVTARLCAGTGP